KLKPPAPAIAMDGGSEGRSVAPAIVMAQAAIPEAAIDAIAAAPQTEATKPAADAIDDRKAAEVAMTSTETMKPREDGVATDARPAQGSDEANAADPTEPIQPIEVAAPVAASDAGNAPALPQRSEPATPARMPPAAAAPRPAEAAPGGGDVFK